MKVFFLASSPLLSSPASSLLSLITQLISLISPGLVEGEAANFLNLTSHCLLAGWVSVVTVVPSLGVPNAHQISSK